MPETTEKQVFKQILKCLPDTPRYKNHSMAVALDIYLVWCGIRHGCIPFDSNLYLQPNTPECDKVIMLLNKIPGIKVVVGPYYFTGISIVVYNINSNAESLLTKIAYYREKHDTLYTKMEKAGLEKSGPKIDKFALRISIENDENIKKISSKIHQLMGKLLGFPCVLDLPYHKRDDGSILYEVIYQIPKINYYFWFWCPSTFKKELLYSVAKLETIKAAFSKLNIPILEELELSIKIK